MNVRSATYGTYRGYTVVQQSSNTVLIFAIGDDPFNSTSISTTWSFDEAERIIDSWLNAI
jgi:hypothetical protein